LPRQRFFSGVGFHFGFDAKRSSNGRPKHRANEFCSETKTRLEYRAHCRPAKRSKRGKRGERGYAE
jgi:hypothetical protein